MCNKCSCGCNQATRQININSETAGRDGLSAYQIAIKTGEFTGTEEEFVNYIKGQNGKSNYQLALENGSIPPNTTLQEYLNSLKAAQFSPQKTNTIVNNTSDNKSKYLRTVYDDNSVMLSNIVDSYTGELLTYLKVTNDIFGNPITDLYVDNVIYIKVNNEYYKRCFSGAVNARWFGAKGDDVNDDSPAINAAAEAARSNITTLYIPSGFYKCNSKLNLTGIRGLQGDVIGATSLRARQAMPLFIDFKNTDRSFIKDLSVECNGLAAVGIDTSYPTLGPSVNNQFERVLVSGYTEWGWVGDNNNDCYFSETLIINPGVAITQTKGAARIYGPGGPVQFSNCNFLDEVHVAAQSIYFDNCVTGGVVIDDVGFNNIGFNKGYIFPSGKTGFVINIGKTKASGYTVLAEAGTISMFSPYIEMYDGHYLIGGPGLLHYGLNVQGGKIFGEYVNTTKPKLIAPTIFTAFQACTNIFTNVRFDNVNVDDKSGVFQNSFINCTVDTFNKSRLILGADSNFTELDRTGLFFNGDKVNGLNYSNGNLKKGIYDLWDADILKYPLGYKLRGQENKDFNLMRIPGVYDIYMADTEGAGWSNYPAGTNITSGTLVVLSSQFGTIQTYYAFNNITYTRIIYGSEIGAAINAAVPWTILHRSDINGNTVYSRKIVTNLGNNIELSDDNASWYWIHTGNTGDRVATLVTVTVQGGGPVKFDSTVVVKSGADTI